MDFKKGVFLGVTAPPTLSRKNHSKLNYYHAGLNTDLFLYPVFSKKELKKKERKAVDELFKAQRRGELILRTPAE